MTGDRILLTGMAFWGRHGVLPEEREQGQPFLVDVELGADLAAAGRADDLALTVDYRRVYAVVREVVEGPPLRLLEAVADETARRLLELSGVRTVTVRVRKPQARLDGPLEAAAVEVRRAAPPG